MVLTGILRRLGCGGDSVVVRAGAITSLAGRFSPSLSTFLFLPALPPSACVRERDCLSLSFSFSTLFSKLSFQAPTFYILPLFLSLPLSLSSTNLPPRLRFTRSLIPISIFLFTPTLSPLFLSHSLRVYILSRILLNSLFISCHPTNLSMCAIFPFLFVSPSPTKLSFSLLSYSLSLFTFFDPTSSLSSYLPLTTGRKT